MNARPGARLRFAHENESDISPLDSKPGLGWSARSPCPSLRRVLDGVFFQS